MSLPLSEELKQDWKETILRQRQSNCSIASWCRQNKIAVHSFYYWQRRLFPKSPLSRSAFTEILEEVRGPTTGIVLEYQGFNIHLNEHFDPIILKKCLEVLKKC